MEEALDMARAKDTKERMAGVERLHELLEASRRSLSSSEVTSLVDCCMDLLKDSNFRVSQGALQSLASAAVLSGEHFKLHLNGLVPGVVDRLGDTKQPVRDAARGLLITLMEVSSPTLIVERAGSYAWTHKSWRVREGFARTVTSAMSLFASTELPLQRAILPHILQMLNDPNHGVREAAMGCIEEMYKQVGLQFSDELHRHHLPSSMLRDINIRLERIEPKAHSSDRVASNHVAIETKPASSNPKRNSPKAKSSSRETSLFGGDNDVTDKPVEPIKVYSEKELTREFEKIASTLVPDKDWSVRIGAMQRVEGLVMGGAADYSCFRGLLKQLVGPLSTQLSDRRSSIVKQVCHLLNFLSKEFLGDFEAFAETFIPVLFKLVVITVLVIAESADNCIKTMLRNCKVARALPRIVDSAKNDRCSLLRARCCEYAVLILECWADEPEIQRAADLYEDLIKCCIADAMSEVRANARSCYRMFAKTWPERSRRLLSSFDPAAQRAVKDEDGGTHRRHASPSVRDRSLQSTGPANLHGYGTSAVISVDKSPSLPSGTSLTSELNLSEAKPDSYNTERSLESVLHASKQKVTAIESLLKGVNASGRHNFSTLRSSSLDLGVEPPSSRDPPFPLAVPASNNFMGSQGIDTNVPTMSKVNNRKGALGLSDYVPQTQSSKDHGRLPYCNPVAAEPLSALSSYSARRASEKLNERASIFESTDVREASRFMHLQKERQNLDLQHKDSNFRDLQNNNVPNFQRPLSRKNAVGRMSVNRRRSFDESQLSLGDMSRYVEGPASLNDALSEGLSSTSDWNARVAAFNYIHSLLQQGPKGIQEVTQSFEKVMKLFFRYLDDPHHKVAQAALTTLADIVPACRKPFESYMERILPHVFSRLIDPKEVVRQPCSTTLDIVSKTYTADSLLAAFLRSLDEQRSPKAKLAVIEFAIGSFNKYSSNSEGFGNSGILKLWLAKLTPLAHDKNTKLKDAAVTCIISVYSRFDSVAVLNYILSLSVEEQNSLRRALKQQTPRIEVDLMNFVQSKKERQQSKSMYDPSDVRTSSEEGYASISKKNQFYGRYSAVSSDTDGGRKWSSDQESILVTSSIGHSAYDDLYHGGRSDIRNESLGFENRDGKYVNSSVVDSAADIIKASSSPDFTTNGLVSSGHQFVNANFNHENGALPVLDLNHSQLAPLKTKSAQPTVVSIPQILHLICKGNEDESVTSKVDGLQQLLDASRGDDQSIWIKYFNQILTVTLEELDNSEPSICETALSLLAEMLKNQKEAMEDSVELLIEKLLHVTNNVIPKVASEAEQCLTIMLSQYDPVRCLSVIIPSLVTEDEKMLVSSVNCLTKLVGRISQQELIEQLPSFLPALFDAFGSQNADVRKTVVFCLVDIYILLGKAFLPYLEGLNSTQLRLVTIYANRISQARTGNAVKV